MERIVVARNSFDPVMQSLKGKAIPTLMRTCYAAVGLAVAYWIFRRPTIKDPLERLRSTGAL